MELKVDVDHKKKFTEADATIQYGKNRKDKNKRISLTTSLNRKETSLESADIDVKVKALAPEHVSITSKLKPLPLAPETVRITSKFKSLPQSM